MAGGDIFGIGTSGLLTSQRQLATTSHNISNVNTDGYSRQRAEQEARKPQYLGNGYIGTGVDVQTTVRLANEFLEEQIRNANSQYGRYDAYLELSSQLDNILANPDSGLTPTLESFFNALQEANDNPSSTPARQVLLTEANTLASRFKLLDDRFIQLNDQVNQQLVDLTQEVTDAARSIAKLNAEIVQKIGAGQGDMPNDLIDQREVLIKKIAENIDVHVVYQDDGAANLFIGSGQTLVIGTIASTLSTQQNQYNALDLDIMLSQGVGSVNITNQVTGGELQGVIEFKQEVLEESRRALGRIAMALSEEMNTQHRLGMTLQGTSSPFPLGGDFFTDLTVPIPALPGQIGTGNFEFNITDTRVLTTSDYRLDYDCVNYRLTRLSDNKQFTSATLNGAGSLNALIDPLDPNFVAGPTADPQGFNINELVAPVAGESFLIRPTFDATANFGVTVNNVLDIALASPLVSRHGNDTDLAIPGTTGSAINSGTGDITLPSITSLNNIPMAGNTVNTFNATLTFVNPNAGGNPGFDMTSSVGILNGVSLDYDPTTDFGGKTFVFDGTGGLPDFGGMSFRISGQPNLNDVFVIENNTDPFDDNRNGLLMSQLQTTKTLENSSTDFQSGYGIIVSNVGTKTHSAEVDLKAQLTLSEQARADRESYSGVNLDEEAANLLKFQQAYQASARVISVADEMFQTLIGAVS